MNKLFRIGHTIIGIAIVMSTLALIFLPNYPMLEFLNEYMIHYVLFLLISGLTGLVFNDRFIIYISFGCAFLLTLFLKFNSNSNLKLPKPNNQPTIGLVHINLSSISSISSLEKIAADSTYDVIAFQEVTPDWDEVLKEVFSTSFPYYKIQVKMDLQGKAIYSRYPFKVLGNHKVEQIEALLLECLKKNEKYHLVSVYLTPPLNRNNILLNEKELVSLSDFVSEIPSPAFIFGELNRVYWAKPIIQFRKKTNLMNSRRNAPLTFKSSYSHIFYSPDMECYFFEDVFDETNTTVGCRGLYQKKKLVATKKRLNNHDF